MTVERVDLSASLALERMAPVSASPAVQGRSSPENGEGKPRRRPPPPEDVSAEPAEPGPAEQDGEDPQHRVDSLA
jgi:hypothetical protein